LDSAFDIRHSIVVDYIMSGRPIA